MRTFDLRFHVLIIDIERNSVIVASKRTWPTDLGLHLTYGTMISFIMAALRSRCGHYIFALWFLSIFFFSPNLSGRRLDVYHNSTHGVALVQI